MSNECTQGQWRVGDAGVTIFGPPNGQPAPEVIATVRKKDNAQRIVTAVNPHDELVEALRKIRARSEWQMELLDARRIAAKALADSGIN